MKEKIRDRQKNSSYPEIRVKRVWVNEFQLYMSVSYNLCSLYFKPSYIRDIHEDDRFAKMPQTCQLHAFYA